MNFVEGLASLKSVRGSQKSLSTKFIHNASSAELASPSRSRYKSKNEPTAPTQHKERAKPLTGDGCSPCGADHRFSMITIRLPDKFTQDKATLEKTFNNFRGTGEIPYKVANPTTPQQLRGLIDNSNVLIIENPKDGSTKGKVTNKENKENGIHPDYLPMSADYLDGMSNAIFLDFENGIDETDVKLATAQDVVDFALKTYNLDVCGVRKSSSGKAGKWHAWVMLDNYIPIDSIKAYINTETPDQSYKLFTDRKNGRPLRRLLNPWADVSVYSRARLTYSVANRGWEYTSDNINPAKRITRALTRLNPPEIPNDYSEAEFTTAKTAHRLSLGLSESEYGYNYDNDLIDKDEIIYTAEGKPVKAGDLGSKKGRYSFIKNERSPSLQYNGNGHFYDFRHQKHYKITDNTVVEYNGYISEAYDFSEMKTGVIHALTGAGKTHAFERPLCLIAVPRRAQTTLESGVSREQIFETLKTKHVIITHDKLLGHLSSPTFITELQEMGGVLIIDEAHTLYKHPKNAPLYNAYAVFLSGTLSRHFRHDLEHITFIPKSGKPVIQISNALDKKGVHTLYFADNVNRITQLAKNADILCAKEHGIEAPAVLTRDTFATSAYREGITLRTKGTFRVVVLSKYCPLWSMYDKVQALYRIRGNDIERTIIGDTKLLDNSNLKPIGEQLEKLRFDGKMSDAFMGEAMGSVMRKMVYGYNDYTEADEFTLAAYYEFVHSWGLPELFEFKQVKVTDYITDPLDGKVEPKEKEPFAPTQFYARGKNWLALDVDPASWAKMANKGVLDKIEEFMPKGVWVSLDALRGKVSPSLTGKRGSLTKKKLYEALKNCIKLEIRDMNGKKQKYFNKNTTEVRLISDCPFGKIEVLGEYTTFHRYFSEIKPILDLFENLDFAA